MGDPYIFCRACAGRIDSEGVTKEGRVISYSCLAEIFVQRDGTVRTIKECNFTKDTRLSP
jgi:hypothetical protein